MIRFIFRVQSQNKDEFSDTLFRLGAVSVSTSDEPVSEADYPDIPIYPVNLLDEEGASKEITAISTVTALYENTESIEKEFQSKYFIRETLTESEWKYRWMDQLTDFEITQGITINPVVFDKSTLKTSEIIPETEKKHGSDKHGSEKSIVIKLDPRDAFGDGKHPTTAMCTEKLVQVINEINLYEKRKYKMLDAGTGTGILAIIAQLLGIDNITAIDIEEESIQRAKINAYLNGCKNITFLDADIKTFNSAEQFNIITANLLTKILEENLSEIKKLLLPDGRLILSGISDTWNESMLSLFNKNELILKDKISCNGWMCYVLTH